MEISREVEDLASRVGHRGALILARRLKGEADLMVSGDADASPANTATGFPTIQRDSNRQYGK